MKIQSPTNLNDARGQATRARLIGTTSLEQIVRSGYKNVIQPEFKVVIERWLASQNDPDTGIELAKEISESFSSFSPQIFGPADINDVYSRRNLLDTI